MSKYKYFNRDISWLNFNYRVLEEAKDKSLPLYERIKFLAIYSNNLEEFYQVRVSYYRQLLRNAELFPEKIDEVQPAKVIMAINELVTRFQVEFYSIFNNEIVPELKQSGIVLLERDDTIPEAFHDYIERFFNSKILSSIQPVLLIKKKVRPFLKDGNVYLILELINKEFNAENALSEPKPKYGMIKLPTDHQIARFVELPQIDDKYYIMFLEDVIMRHVDKIFPGYEVRNWYSIKLTRDADLDYDEYEGEELIEAITKISSSRSLGKPNRFLYDREMPARIVKYLADTFKLKNDTLVKGGAYHNFRDFFSFPNPNSPLLENEKLPPLRIPYLERSAISIFNAIAEKDILLNPPYQSYDYFIRFLEKAGLDETVKEIKITQYRLASNSAVVNALIDAAENGKLVTVFVELKARFDEEANLEYAREMKKAGIKIIYSIAGLKVHAKIALIIRKKKNCGEYKDQAFLATGNFNEKTARLYCDHGLFTSHNGIVRELKYFFKYLEDQSFKVDFKHILIPGFNLTERFSKMIEQEMKNVSEGKKGYIFLKMNGLQDPEMVDKLYRASEAGVKIDLVIRGICILKTGKSYSKNIQVIRIVDRFLEHARIYKFHNNGDELIYLGSADWMKRNLYRRIECVFPIYDSEIKNEINDLIQIQLSDNVKACLIGENMENVRIANNEPSIRSQLVTYNYFKLKYPKDIKKIEIR